MLFTLEMIANLKVGHVAVSRDSKKKVYRDLQGEIRHYDKTNQLAHFNAKDDGYAQWAVGKVVKCNEALEWLLTGGMLYMLQSDGYKRFSRNGLKDEVSLGDFISGEFLLVSGKMDMVRRVNEYKELDEEFYRLFERVNR